MRQRIIDAGYLDALIRAIGALPAAIVRETSAAYLAIVRRMREGTPWDRRGGWAAWREVAEQARLAANRAKKLERDGGDGSSPRRLPVPGDPTGPASTRAEYSVIVVYYDPATGGTNRQRAVITDDAGLTHQQIATLAALAGTGEGSWTTSGIRGEITPESAVYSTVIVIGIVGVR